MSALLIGLNAVAACKLLEVEITAALRGLADLWRPSGPQACNCSRRAARAFF